MEACTQRCDPIFCVTYSTLITGTMPSQPVVVGRRYAQFEPPDLHSIHKGTVVGLQDFGAFVRIECCSRDGLVHVSQMKHAQVLPASDPPCILFSLLA